MGGANVALSEVCGEGIVSARSCSSALARKTLAQAAGTLNSNTLVG
jgi:hypothetical protein